MLVFEFMLVDVRVRAVVGMEVGVGTVVGTGMMRIMRMVRKMGMIGMVEREMNMIRVVRRSIGMMGRGPGVMRLRLGVGTRERPRYF